MAILASFIGILVIVPVAVTVATTARSQGSIDDANRDLYVADSSIQAVVSDLVRGASADPTVPFDYIPPVVMIDSLVPFTTIRALDPPKVSTVKPIEYLVSGNPANVSGASPSGNGLDLNEVDAEVYKITGIGVLPGADDIVSGVSPASAQAISYEVTSEVIGFSALSSGRVTLNIQAWEESARLDIFVKNAGGYDDDNPDKSVLLDHDHLSNHANHNHDSGPETW